MTKRDPIAPGAVIGILGGGQLGRMTALAAAELGYRSHIFCPEKDSPGSQVAWATTCAGYDDHGALERFAASVDVVTFEFENIPHASVRLLADIVPVRPDWNALRVAQNRVVEKEFLNGIGIATAPWRAVDDVAALALGLEALGRPAVLKTTRMGYDGKGQVMIGAGMAADEAWRRMGADSGILEGFINFACEISVIVARGLDGQARAYVPVENRHANHILAETLAPARIDPAVARAAEGLAFKIAQTLDLVGLLAIEMFVTQDGQVLANEVAPRPHNSGHWTIDACATSQFEQFVRAICGLPLGSPERHSDAVMENLLGDQVERWSAILAEPDAKLHLYGKHEALSGRKMGHVTRLYPKSGRF
ncbi:MAG: 5-(carboxyamino)imidazole ribonucleotide synthase [Alphaproteobacteria bacterium]|nr:5-(carboxyamino)imidazole ribonucleotide synthase [Alphaproteobacteria bacterium]